MLAPAIDVQEIHEVFPVTIQHQQVAGDIFAVGEFSIVRIDLVFHPAQVFHGFTLARIETLNHGFALSISQLVLALFFATFNVAAIEGTGRHDGQVNCFGPKAHEQRSYIPKEGRSDGKTGHTPEIQGFLKSLFQVSKVDFGQLHLWYDRFSGIVRNTLMLNGHQDLGVVSPRAGKACGAPADSDPADSKHISRLYVRSLSCNCISMASRSISCIWVSTEEVPSCIFASAAAARRSILSRISSKVPASSPSWNDAIVCASCSCSLACLD